MAFIPKPQFPNVPKLPGVPQLNRSNFSLPAPGPVLGTAAALGALWRSLFALPKWGIFKMPEPTAPNEEGIETVTVTAKQVRVVEADSVLDFGYRSDYDIPDYQVEEGSFTAYNKVNMPFEASVRFSKGGSEEARARFLRQLETVVASLDLFQIVTPERKYDNVNAMRLEVVRRGGAGAYFLTEVDLYFREIRTTTAQYTTTAQATQNARDPSADAVENRGTVAGQRPAVEPQITGVVNE